MPPGITFNHISSMPSKCNTQLLKMHKKLLNQSQISYLSNIQECYTCINTFTQTSKGTGITDKPISPHNKQQESAAVIHDLFNYK